jgi:Zn-dependent protease/CBS domain-containing protein
MRGSIRLLRIAGISINIHISFLLLLALFASGGLKWLFIIVAVFFFVTLHELCHSLAARQFGIRVSEITLLPIGGVASMARLPEKPSQEFLISVAGPAFNIAVILVFFFPLKILLGPEVLMHPLSTATWPLTVAYIYWINLMLALFNLIPAFPMDGGRVLRALLAQKMGYLAATRIAVRSGHIFALIFAYFGLIRFNIILIAIAIFIYMAASSEEMQVDVREALKKLRVRDILSRDFLTVSGDATLADVLAMMLHSRQEDFPVVDEGRVSGFLTRRDIIVNVHGSGTAMPAKEAMRTSFPHVRETDSLAKVQNTMQESVMAALPVMRGEDVVGIVTLEDIGRAYAVLSQR